MFGTDVATARCPKCHAERLDEAEECVRCGIIFAKYKPLTAKANRLPTPAAFTESKWFRIVKQWLIESDTATDSMTLYGRVVVFLGMVWWGWKFIITPLETNYAGESFLHLINLPFHEAGHLIFMPFGRLMMFLGGTLGQTLMPLICLGTFLVKTRDPFGGAVALWWTAESLMDIASYINDARALDLVLIGGVTGKETDGHDWNNILTMLNLLERDHWLAHFTSNIGILLFLASFLWGGTLLLRHYRRLSI